MRCVRSLLLFGFFCLGGCASDRDAIDKRLAELGKDIQRLQSSNEALSDRVEGLETKLTAPLAPPVAEDEGSRLERPPLRVVKLVPGAASGSASSSEDNLEVAAEDRPDAPGQRPLIRLRGSGGKESPSKEGSAKLARTPSSDESGEQ